MSRPCLFEPCPGTPYLRGMCGAHYRAFLRGTVTLPKPEQPVSAPKGWQMSGACRTEDPEIWFPVGSSGPALAQIAEAKRVCHRCTVATQCLSWALDTGQSHGVWGGLSEDERRALKADTRSLITTGGAR